MRHKPTMLVILDGWGWREDAADNAVLQARTPHFDRLWNGFPHAFLTAHGEAVGLPEGQMGNSEVGHLNIGAGRIVMQELPRIDKAARGGELAERVRASGLIEAVGGKTCHIIGLMSPGGVHAHQDHAVALARILTRAGVAVKLHAFTDGRDTAPDAARKDVARLEAALPAGARIATVCGRFYAMDRDKRWERVSRAYAALVDAQGARFDSAEAVLEAASAAGTTDEFVEPAVIGEYAGFEDGDAILVTNFRADRIRELLDAMLEPGFEGFERRQAALSAAVGMVSYSVTLDRHMKALFEPQTLEHGLSQTASEAGLRQVHLAETEKYPHVTYFLNGGSETPWPGESWVTVPSPRVATYDLQPQMSAPELGAKVREAVAGGADLVVVNFANPDMVGHTGSLPAAIAAVEAVDRELGPIADAVLERGGALLVTADHGNCEMMRDPETGGPHTAHTLNPVPVIVAGAGNVALSNGILADIAPTILELAGVGQPAEMTGRSLIGRG
ncbi:2,3-bisphosphoglycerate-independent phosphoglycerate mutase [Aureimonas populi]|uniref:2,3-bisphosphoglycerate-independent phosphoglycerate mutase n=1 Tax=Aureimonas populi TaxID=1701758 RepID=A0ABW5CIZ1_9HYPH|nr:2,3-bisphosphoglycerate-independent phosphoglycerate mutase [Aureimonas populi]